MKITFNNTVGNIEIYMDCLRAICGETEGKSMVDMCCAFAPNTPKLGFSTRLYIDVIDRKLDHENEQIHFWKADVLTYIGGSHIKDVAICSDGIEHFTEDDGYKLIDIMEKCSRKQVIFTPLGDLWMEKVPSDNPEAHRSAWYPEMLPGWATIVFPQYHREWGAGAFFAWRCDNLQQDYERIYLDLMSKNWTVDQKIVLG